MTSTTKPLRSRVLKASIWSIGRTGFGQALRLANNLILTRLLVPEMFGLMAIVNTITWGIAQLSHLGLYLYIIQSKRGDDPDFLNSIWSITIVRGLLLWVVALLLCLALFAAGQYGWLAANTTYAEPILPYALAIASSSLAIMGFQSTKEATATRHLAQNVLFFKDLYSQGAGIVVMILWALIDRSIWALVAGPIVSTFVGTILSHTMLPGVSNRWQWSWPIFWAVLNFGQWILLSTALSFLYSNGDRLLLGGLLSAETLGIYSIGFMIVNTIKNAFDTINANVAYPALTEVYRDNPYGLKQAYYRFRSRLDPMLILAAALLMGLGQIIIDILFDSRYASAGLIVQLFSLLLIAQIYELASRCFLTLGKPKLLSILNAIKAVALFVLVPVGFMLFDLIGAIWGIVLSHFSAVPATMIITARHGILDRKWEFTVLAAWIGILGSVYALVFYFPFFHTLPI